MNALDQREENEKTMGWFWPLIAAFGCWSMVLYFAPAVAAEEVLWKKYFMAIAAGVFFHSAWSQIRSFRHFELYLLFAWIPALMGSIWFMFG